MLHHDGPTARTRVLNLGEKPSRTIVYPTPSTRPGLTVSTPGATPPAGQPSATNIANPTGFPDLIVPAGFTGDRLPVAISFVGPAFSEGRLLALGYSFEQATRARRRPVHTPALPGEAITLKD
jgi:amidase